MQACAPRWVSVDTDLRSVDQGRPHGRCFLSGRNLEEFEILRPCSAFFMCLYTATVCVSVCVHERVSNCECVSVSVCVHE